MNNGQFSLFTLHQWNCNRKQTSRQDIILLHQSARVLCCVLVWLQQGKEGGGERLLGNCFLPKLFFLLPLSLPASSQSLVSLTSSISQSPKCILIHLGTFPSRLPISPSPPLNLILLFFQISLSSFVTHLMTWSPSLYIPRLLLK